MPLEEGTKLGCSWANRWHNVTVLDVYDDEDKVVRIHWDDYGAAWDGDISRDCLIIEKKILAALKKKQANTKPKTDDTTVAESDADLDEESTSDRESKSTSSPTGGHELILTDVGKNRFAVIKIVVELTKLSLTDAKELVENLPFPIMGELTEEEALELQQKIEKAGGQAEIK